MSSRARNKLTVKQVAAITKAGVHSDGGGLYLRVRPPARSWFYIGTHNGKRLELGLGSDLDISLAKAREKAAEIRAMLLDGKDPRQERKEKKRQNAATFGAFALALIDDIEGGFKNPKHRQQWRNTLTTYAKPLWALSLNEVHPENIKAILLPIWMSKPETASRVRGRIERILDAAKVKGLRTGDNPARWKGNLVHLLPKRSKATVKHHAALPFGQIAAFMTELQKRPAVAARALEFTVLTAARSGETRGMTWAEVDLGAKLWTVPKERMKAEKEHKVPLSEAAMTILTAMWKDGLKPIDYVFPAPRGGSFSDMALSQLIKRMGRPDITVHGFRSTFRDWAGDATNFQREVIEMALAHGISSKTEAAYRRADALDKRRDVMNAWADYCAGKVVGIGVPVAPHADQANHPKSDKYPSQGSDLVILSPVAKFGHF